ncbi:MAG: uncharacterized protein JWR62_692 [Modestobacter sp.]|jgi:hypothetical protein|nr:uncharacterized protein [Modestobacter sp.]
MTTIPEVAPNTPEVLEEFSLVTAVTRLDFLARRNNHVVPVGHDATDDHDSWGSIKEATTSLDAEEALELLALGEVVARKAHASRLEGILAALRGGAGWAEIAAALDVPPPCAWDEYTGWLDEQHAAQERGDGVLDPGEIGAARELAGVRPRD